MTSSEAQSPMNIALQTDTYEVAVAQTQAEQDAVYRLRYDVFVDEGGAGGGDAGQQHETDRFDPFATHLILRDLSLPCDAQIVGTYRLLDANAAVEAGGFYTEDEFNLTALKRDGGRLLEVGRSCLRPSHRGGVGLLKMWQGLAAYAGEHEIDHVFGVASFSGIDPARHLQSLALLHQDHRMEASMCPAAFGHQAIPLANTTLKSVDRRAAMIGMPAVIKAYLRMGARVGDGAFIDTTFQTIDVCMVLKANDLSARQRAFLGGQ